ncbi:MAG: YbaB/EbfC family nucleoid-associated protein, partial [Myxococcota bacterium]
MKAAQGLKGQLEAAQEQAEKLRVTGEAGGGMVKVTMNGRYEVISLD